VDCPNPNTNLDTQSPAQDQRAKFFFFLIALDNLYDVIVVYYFKIIVIAIKQVWLLSKQLVIEFEMSKIYDKTSKIYII